MGHAIDVLVVASWYPSVEDVSAGRFVADEVVALHERGGVRPAVVTFEPARLSGAPAARARQVPAVAMVGEAVVADPTVFASPASGVDPRVPVARLTVCEGVAPATGATHRALGREMALASLVDRWSSRPIPGVRRPVLIHAHTGYPDGVAAVAIADAFGLPLVITEHASFLARLFASPEIRSEYVRAGRRAARLIAVSETLAGELRDSVPELRDRIVVIPNAVAVDDFGSLPLAERHPDELLFVGYLGEHKGIESLLKAVAQVRRERPGATLRLVGEARTAELDQRWRRQARDLGIAEAVRFDGPGDRAHVARAMAEASIFVHPSRRETFGVVAAEALASGTPVVATDSGGVTEILGPQPELFGALVPPENPEALAQAIVGVLERREAFDPEHLRRSIVERYGADTVAARLTALYEEVLAEHRGASTARRPTVAPAPAPADPPGGRRPVVAAGEARVSWIVVALAPDLARMVSRLDPRCLSRTVLVTSDAYDERPPQPWAAIIRANVGSTISLMSRRVSAEPRGSLPRRLARAARHPVALARRKGLLPDVDAVVARRGSRAIREALRTAQMMGVASAGPLLVCIGGLDHVAAHPVLARNEARLAPGGFLWLGDQVTES